MKPSRTSPWDRLLASGLSLTLWVMVCFVSPAAQASLFSRPAAAPLSTESKGVDAPAGWRTLEGRVVGVSDGDTVTILSADKQSHKIRLLAIDTPEKAMPFGQRAKQQLSDWVFHKTVQVHTRSQDRYGRVIGKVLLDGEDINLKLVTQGMAWHYEKYRRDHAPGDDRRYAQAQAEARAGGRGLWSDRDPTPPWQWREVQRQQRP